MAGEPMAALLEKLPAATEAATAEEPVEEAEGEGDDTSLPTARVAERSAMANLDQAITEGAGVGKAVRDLVRICVRKYGSK